jgi:hypothetical protein
VDASVLSARWGAEEINRLVKEEQGAMASASSTSYSGGNSVLKENAALKAQVAELHATMETFLADQHAARIEAVAKAKAETAAEYDARIAELEAQVEDMELMALYGGNERAAQAAKINKVFQSWK